MRRLEGGGGARRRSVSELAALLGRHGASVRRLGEWNAKPPREGRSLEPLEMVGLQGRFVEISSDAEGGAALSVAMRLVRDAQRSGEWAAWVAASPALFFPPDAHEAGVDLGALAVVRAEAASPCVRLGRKSACVRAAEELLASGGFGVVVLDLAGRRRSALTLAAQARLSALVERERCTLIALTCKSARAPSIGARIDLRWHARCLVPTGGLETGGGEEGDDGGRSGRWRERRGDLASDRNRGWFVAIEPVRDKRGALGRRVCKRARLPLGLR